MRSVFWNSVASDIFLLWSSVECSCAAAGATAAVGAADERRGEADDAKGAAATERGSVLRAMAAAGFGSREAWRSIIWQ